MFKFGSDGWIPAFAGMTMGSLAMALQRLTGFPPSRE
jgi:hypothetical protein